MKKIMPLLLVAGLIGCPTTKIIKPLNPPGAGLSPQIATNVNTAIIETSAEFYTYNAIHTNRMLVSQFNTGIDIINTYTINVSNSVTSDKPVRDQFEQKIPSIYALLIPSFNLLGYYGTNDVNYLLGLQALRGGIQKALINSGETE